MNLGWIKLHRELMENWVWRAKPFSKGQAWVDLLLLANYEDKKVFINGELTVCKCGDVNRSVSWLADRWGWGRSKVARFLSALELDGMCHRNSTTHGTTLTIENYTTYQETRSTNRATDGQPMGNQRATDGHIQEYKEYKEIKNNNNNSVADAPPTIGEVKDYISQGGYAVDAEEFFDYYSGQGWTKANGKPVVDWKACVRSWHRRKKGTTSEEDEKAKARSKALAELKEAERRMVAEANEKVKSRKEHE